MQTDTAILERRETANRMEGIPYSINQRLAKEQKESLILTLGDCQKNGRFGMEKSMQNERSYIQMLVW